MKSWIAKAVLVFAGTMLLASWYFPTIDKNSADALSNEKKIEELIAKMTLQEKIGQMTQICFSTITLDGTKQLDVSPDKFKEAILKYHVGSFLSGSGPAEKWVDFTDAVQRIAVEESRLGIPLILGVDHVHGANYVDEGTIFPHNLTLSCSFDTALMAEGARVVAVETADLGLQWNFAPVLDVGKNPYWPRLYETFGEDPLVCARMGVAFSEAYQNCTEVAPYKLSACAKHFIGYSDPKSGRDRSTSEIPDQVLYETFVPPFEAAFESGIKTVMVNSGDLNGMPVHVSKKILTGLLREKLSFDGVVLTDIKDIDKVLEMHSGAETFKEACLRSINAGVDMYMACNAYHFCSVMEELVKEGSVSEKRIDESVRRILKLKFDLGIFEHPYPRKDCLKKIGSASHKAKAVKAAEESIVLLKNDGILPLKKGTKVLIAGEASDSKHFMAGPWTYEWLGQPDESKHPAEMKTLFSALKDELGKNTSKFANAESDLEGFKKAAASADVLVLTVGEKPYSEFKGNTTTLNLEEQQQLLLEAAASTGKKVVVVMLSGRPRIITKHIDGISAFLFAGIPGYGGGEALGNIISGKVNPSGKLSFSYPCDAGSYEPYNRKYSSQYWEDYTKLCTALFPFGSGESYASFEYSNLVVKDTTISGDELLKAEITLKNTGSIDGKEIALWFMRDEVGTIVRPIKQLVDFQKIELKSGGSQKLSLVLNPKEEFTYPDDEGNLILENGYFTLEIGGQQQRFRYEK